MLPFSLNQALVLYTWFPLAALLFFLFLIARFYQRFSDKRTYFRLYLAPIVLFGAGLVRRASVGPLADDLLANGLMAAAGLTLLALSIQLYRRMLLRPIPLKKQP